MGSEVKVGVVGLGYVGLPLALAFARKYRETVGFDLNAAKVASIRSGRDPTDEGLDEQLRSTTLKVDSNPQILRGANFIVVGVPTPVDVNKTPDLGPVLSACRLVGENMSRGTTVVFESTVYPGVTEDLCAPALEEASGLKHGVDFKLGYSPERINPGDRLHTVEKIVKVVSGEDQATLDLVAEVYGSVIGAGIHRAPSIKVAEAAKVIENTQRDINIALMNELAIIFDRMGISTRDVLAAAGTKWNFLKFVPGLVGGHCIGVDPYYLTCKAQQLGYHPEVILAGRRINDGMGVFIAQKVVKMMVNRSMQPRGARVGVLGLTFKEDVSDIRNSRVPDILNELRQFGMDTLVFDPHADQEHALEEYGVKLCRWEDLRELDALVVAVAHDVFRKRTTADLTAGVKRGGIVADVKGVLDPAALPGGLQYWSL